MPYPVELMCGYQSLCADSLCYTQHLYVRDVILQPNTENVSEVAKLYAGKGLRIRRQGRTAAVG